MNLYTFLFYSQISAIVLPQQSFMSQKPMASNPMAPLAYISLKSSSSNRFIHDVAQETKFIKAEQSSEYIVPEDNMSHASAMGITLGMLQTMKIRSQDFGQRRLAGLAYTLVMNDKIRYRARRLRKGDVFRVVVEAEGKIRLTLTPSTVRSRALLLSKIMSIKPQDRKRKTVFKNADAQNYVGQVTQRSKVMADGRSVHYTVHADDISNASAMGTALGMLRALNINAPDYGQTRLNGLALRLVLRKAVRRKVRSFRKGDIFSIRADKNGRISLNIESIRRNRYHDPLPMSYKKIAAVKTKRRPKKKKKSPMLAAVRPVERKEEIAKPAKTERSPIIDETTSKTEADTTLAALSNESLIPDGKLDKEDEADLDAAFKPENIIKNNITAIINETMAELEMPKPEALKLRGHLRGYLMTWSKEAKSVNDKFVEDFLSVIATDLGGNSSEASKKVIRLALKDGLKQEHEVYNTKEEALRETAKEILETVKEMKEETQDKTSKAK